MDIGTTTKLAIWIRRYGKNLLIAMLVAAIMYQEIRRVKEHEEYRQDMKEWKEELKAVNEKSIQFEREMREKYLDEIIRKLH